MNPQDPLAGLHPLREPLPIGWWPPAPGWWILAGALIIALLVFTWILVRRHQARAYRRQALAQLELLRAQYQHTQDTNAYLAAANALLKSTALVAYPRREIAASSGTAWLDFLNAGLTQAEQLPGEFVTGAYRKSSAAIDVEHLHRAAASWIRRHKVKP